MDNVFAAVFLAMLVVYSVKVPFFLVKNAGQLTQEFDQLLIDPKACRSNYEETFFISSKFSPEPVVCPFKRADFGTIGTRGHWPYAVCVILQATPSILITEGNNPCSYLD